MKIIRKGGDMMRSVYDPDLDGVIAVAQTEADMKKSVYDTDNNGYIEIPLVIASDDLIGSSDAETSTISTTPVKVKELTLMTIQNINATLRIKFDLKENNPPYTAYAQIHKNGTAIGTLQQTTLGYYTTFSEDIANWINGDKIQLYIYCGTSGTTTLACNFRVYGKIDKIAPTLSVS
jgi:hypothetical protein